MLLTDDSASITSAGRFSPLGPQALLPLIEVKISGPHGAGQYLRRALSACFLDFDHYRCRVDFRLCLSARRGNVIKSRPESTNPDCSLQSKCLSIVFTTQLLKKKDDEEKRFSMLRTYSVFNVAQIDGLPAPQEAEELPEPVRHERAEAFIKATKADFKNGGDKACYVPSQDFIAMPYQGFFIHHKAFYAVALHELGHNAELRIMPREPRFPRETQSDQRGNAA
jgi:hypothetical protein